MKTVSLRPKFGLWAAGLASVVLLGACAPIHTTGSGAVNVTRKQYATNLVSEQQLAQEAQQQYASILAQARAKGALDTNAQQTQRVRIIANRLVSQVGVFRPDARNWPWEVHVLDSNEVNAWCMPSGKIAVYSGLITQLKPTDAELAAVIGHEIAHALREHAREQVSQAMASSIGLSVLAAVTGSQQVSSLGGRLTEVMFTLPNSRSHEQEADRIGVELAARAGYDPRAAVSLWQKMAQLEKGNRPPEFMSTHPAPANRIADLERISNQLMPVYQASKR